MNKIVLSLLIFSFVSFSHAETRRVETKEVFKDVLEISRTHKNFAFSEIALIEVDAKVEHIDRDVCTEDSFSCSEEHVLEKAPAVKVTVSYDRNPIWSGEEGNTESLDFFFPVSVLSKEDMAYLKKNTGFWDFTGSKLKNRRELAQKLFSLETEVVTKQITAVDEKVSDFCNSDDLWCTDIIRYKPRSIKVQKIKVGLK